MSRHHRPLIGPVEADDTVVQNDTRIDWPSLYRVLMLDDDYTPMDFVEHLLEKFFHMNREQATRTMLEVHHSGVGLCGIFQYEVAESKVSEVTAYARAKNHPLEMALEKE